MKVGLHIKIGGGLGAAADYAAEIGCETIQIFAGNPNAWNPGKLDLVQAQKFRESIERSGISPVIIHTQYLVNMAAPDPDIYLKSTNSVLEALRRASILGAQYVVTHIGSHKGAGFEQGLELVRQSLSTALTQADNDVVLLLENSAGAGGSLGTNFENLHAILASLPEFEQRLGILLDTAHTYAAGYDLSSADAVNSTLAAFDSVVGLNRLKAMHLNDTPSALGSHLDRHANTGAGNIGEAGFRALINHPALVGLPGIIETPRRGGKGIEDLAIVKQWRDGK
ncbi:MAG TPA: deoxyribonuclease IV [Armatimonadota bacterium]|nr:deoxyribonuclease IV [Armatimonadota bacterium]